jgi:outer membrane protein
MSVEGCRAARVPGLLGSIVLVAVLRLAVCQGGESAAADAYPGGLPGDVEPVACPLVDFEANTTLVLAKAVDLALCNNAQIRDAWVSIRVQAAALGQARAAYWPTITANFTELGDRTAYPGQDTPATTRSEGTVYGSLTWRLFDFGGRASAKRAAGALLEAAVASRDATIQKTLGEVVQAYFDAITAKAIVDNKIADEALARDTLEAARRRQTRGASAQSDALQATTALEKVSLDKNRSIGSYVKAIAVLVYTLGLRPSSQLSLPDDVDFRTGDEQQDLSAWLQEAEQRHPSIVAARAAVAAAYEEVTAARSSGRPTIDFTSNYYQNAYPGQGLTSTNTKVTTFGVSVTVPLFDGFATHYRVRGAEQLAKSKEAELQDIEQQTLMGIVRAHADAESSLANLRVSEDLMQAAQASAESSERRYNSGVADILELLSTQVALADAKGERARCLAEWRTARLTLLSSAGVLNRIQARE